MSYDVKVAEIDEMFYWISRYTQEVSSQLVLTSAAVERLVALESFQGEAASNVKAYFHEVHAPALAALQVLLANIFARCAEYTQPYFTDIDGSMSARFNQDALLQTQSSFSLARGELADKFDALEKALSPVGDLVDVWAPPIVSIDDCLYSAAETPLVLDASVSDHETHHAAQAQAIEELVASAKAFLSAGGALAPGGMDYVSGAISTDPSFTPFSELFTKVTQYISDETRTAYVETAADECSGRVKARWGEADALAELDREGMRQMIAAGLTILGGAIGLGVCIMTGGAATPVVALAAGTFVASSAFQGAEIYEGREKMGLAFKGDTSTQAYNPLRDTVFGGNQDLYDTTNKVVSFAADLAVPAGMLCGSVAALKAGGGATAKAMFKSAAEEGAKEFVADQVSGQVTGFVAHAVYGDTDTANYFEDALSALGSGARSIGGLPKAAHKGFNAAAVRSRENPLHPKDFGLDDLEFEEHFFMGPTKPGDAPDFRLSKKEIPEDKPLSQRERRAAQLEKNKAQGKAYADARFAEFKKLYPNAQREITIELDDGTRIRVDAIAVDKDGNLVIQEYKSSKTAPFTENQEHAYTDNNGILNLGGTIVGDKGINAFGKGVRVEAGDKVHVIRPTE